MSIATPFRLTSASSAPVVRRTQMSLILSLLMFAVYIFLARLQPELRYTRYALPAALATLWLARRAQERQLVFLTAPLSTYAAVTAAICVWSAVAIGVTSSYYPRFFEEALFLAAPLGAATICASLKRDDGEWPFYALLAILAIDYFWEIGLSTIADGLRQPSAFAADLLQSTAASESVRAFSFGLLAIFFLARRHLPGAMVSALLALLAGKRIVVLGLLVAAPLVFVAPSLERPKRRALVTLIAVGLNVATAMSLRNLDEWGIADRIQEITLQSADAVLMGRAKLYALLSDRLPATPIVGAGLGRITYVLESENAWLTNTHSDVLKHFIELGPVMFAGWIGCFYWTARRKSTLALAVFMNVLFLSDNVSIYFDVMFPFYLSCAYLDQERSAVRSERTVRRRPPCIEPASQAA